MCKFLPNHALLFSSCSKERGDMGQSEGSGVRNGNFQQAGSSVTQSSCTHFTTAPAGQFLHLTSQTLPHSGDEWEEGGSQFCFKDTAYMYVEGQSQPRRDKEASLLFIFGESSGKTSTCSAIMRDLVMALLRKRTCSGAAVFPASPSFRCENSAPSQQHSG